MADGSEFPNRQGASADDVKRLRQRLTTEGDLPTGDGSRWDEALTEAAASLLTFRQEPGSKNPLGKVRIDMPNRNAVYMHDTPMQRLFADDYCFLSHGCARVDGINDLASRSA
jgi:hypothetical protein